MEFFVVVRIQFHREWIAPWIVESFDRFPIMIHIPASAHPGCSTMSRPSCSASTSFLGNLGDHRVSPQFCFIWKAETGYRTLTPTLPFREE